MADVAKLSDKVMVMDGGKLVMMDTPEKIFAQKERLAQIGLSVPPITSLMHKLKEKDLDIKTNILNMKDAEEEIYNFLKRKQF